MSIDWRPFVELVRGANSFVLTSHMRPDCDAIGSERGMAYALQSLGKRVRIVNGDAVPPHIKFIDPNGEVGVLGRDVTAGDLTCDVHLVLDTSAWAQLGPMADVFRATKARKAVIDHHASQDDMGATMFKETTAESTGRLVLEAADALGAKITQPMAEALYAAIATDTGWFRFASVGEATLAAAARLVAAGARPDVVFSALYEQNSLARLLLQGRILQNVKSDSGGRMLYTAITQADLVDTGAEPTDTEDVVNRLLSVAGVQVAILFLEFSATETKVSLRSRSFDVCRIAEQFGGGGHRAAAGVRFPGPLAKAVPAVLDSVQAAFGEAPRAPYRDVQGPLHGTECRATIFLVKRRGSRYDSRMNSANRKSAAPAQVERRPFLVRFLAALLSGIAVLVPIAAGGGLLFDPLIRRKRRDESDGKKADNFLRVGPLDLLPADGTPRLFVLTADRSDAWTRMTKQRVGAVFLSREDVDGEPRVTAFAATCPHLGCTVDFNPSAKQFACPCHDASFAADGSRISGPSQRGLDPLEVDIRRDAAGPASIYVAYQRFLPGIAGRKPLT